MRAEGEAVHILCRTRQSADLIHSLRVIQARRADDTIVMSENEFHTSRWVADEDPSADTREAFLLNSIHPDYLIASIETMGAAFGLYNRTGRLVAFNRRYQFLREIVGGQARQGASWEDSAAETVGRGSIPEALGREEDWLRRRRAVRGRYSSLRPWPDGRLIQIHERGTPEGGVVVIWTEVSKLPYADRSSLAHSERQIVSLLARGTSVAEAATILGISRRSVISVRHRVMDRHHLQTVEDFRGFAVENGLLASPVPLQSPF